MQIFLRKLSIVAILLTAFGASHAAEQDVLFGNKWTIGILNHIPVRLANFTLGRAYIEFNTNNQFSGYTGCNIINGTFILTPPNGLNFNVNNLVVNPKAPCSADLKKFENEFITMLQNAKFWKMTGDDIIKALNLQNDPENVSAIFAIISEHE